MNTTINPLARVSNPYNLGWTDRMSGFPKRNAYEKDSPDYENYENGYYNADRVRSGSNR